MYKRQRLHLIPSPLILGSPELAQVMFQEESVQRIQQMSRVAKMTVVGIGSMGANATIIQNGILTKADFLLLEMQGAVGDILSHFIDKDGNPIQSCVEQRLLSTPLQMCIRDRYRPARRRPRLSSHSRCRTER